VADRGGALNVWDLQGDGEARALEEDDQGLKRFAVTPDGRSAVSINLPRATLKVWDLASGALVRAIEGCPAGLQWVFVSGDGRRAFLGEPPQMTVVDIEAGVIERRPQGGRSHLSRLGRPAVTEDGRFAVTSSDDRLGSLGAGPRGSALEVWDLREGGRVAALPLNLRASHCAIAADGRWIVTGDSQGTLRFIEWVRS
jgi:WD40 repeat protein